MNLLRKTLLGLAFALPAVCIAQWQWIDKDGRKVFSDKAPPPEIPSKSILRQPGGRASTAAAPAAAAADPAASAAQAAKPAASAPKLTGKDKELEEKRKQAEAADAEKKKAQQEEAAKQRAENCTYARRNKATFDSGVRIARTNDKGEREYMDDATRAAENKRVDAIIARDCQAPGG